MYTKEAMKEVLEKYGYIKVNNLTTITPEWYAFAAQLLILERLDNLQLTNEYILERLGKND